MTVRDFAVLVGYDSNRVSSAAPLVGYDSNRVSSATTRLESYPTAESSRGQTAWKRCMNTVSLIKTMAGEIRAQVLALGLCLLILIVTLQLWHADLCIPFEYSSDSLFTQLWIKGIIENGWYLHNDHVGIPGGSDLQDFPMADNLHFLLLKALACFTSDAAVVFNLYYLLSFPVVVISSVLVLRRLGLANHVAILTALLYAFLPYHFLRGLAGHLFLMSYFMVPPVVLVATWIGLSGRPSSDPEEQGECRPCLDFTKARWGVSILVCVLVSSTGIYYALFGCFLFGIAGLYSLAHRGKCRGLKTGAILTLIVLLGLAANLLPSLLNRLDHGANPGAVERVLKGPEIYGMKITQLVVPMSMHRLAFLGHKKLAYSIALPLGSNDFGYLGVAGVVGFLVLVGRLIFRSSKGSTSATLDILATFNVFTILLATAGGFGMVGSLIVGPWLRCFERMSIFIAFFALIAFGAVLDLFIESIRALMASRILSYSFLGLVLVGAISDQTSNRFVPRYDAVREQYAQNARFIQEIESAMPAGAAIFQLPYMPFPESPPIVRMGDYEHLRGYLHSKTLRWSYGTIKGREGDRWYKEVASKPVDVMLQDISAAGFNGIALDRHGYSDSGAEIERKLVQLLGREPLVSPDSRLTFFDFRAYKARNGTKIVSRLR